MKKKILGLIPVRLGSTRLPAKALLPINNLPLIIHVYKRAKLSKKLDDVISLILLCFIYRDIYIQQLIL